MSKPLKKSEFGPREGGELITRTPETHGQSSCREVSWWLPSGGGGTEPCSRTMHPLKCCWTWTYWKVQGQTITERLPLALLGGPCSCLWSFTSAGAKSSLSELSSPFFGAVGVVCPLIVPVSSYYLVSISLLLCVALGLLSGILFPFLGIFCLSDIYNPCPFASCMWLRFRILLMSCGAPCSMS